VTSVDVEAQVERAAVLCELRRYQEAVSVLSAVLASCPDAVEGWGQLSLAQLGDDQPEAAYQAAMRAAALAPDSGMPLRLISAALDRLGRTDEAVLAARRAVAVEPYDWQCQIQLGIALLSAGHAAEARAVADRAAAMGPHASVSHLLLGDVARAQRRWADAENHVRDALAIDPTSPATLSHLALVELRRFRYLSTSRLVRSAGQIADAVRADVRDTTIHDGLDRLLILFVYGEAMLVWLVSFVLRPLGEQGSAAARAVPALLLAIPAVRAARTVRALPPQVRGRLSTVVRERRIAAALALLGLAVLASLFAAVAPVGMRQRAVPIAAGCAAWAAFLIQFHQRRLSRRLSRRFRRRPFRRRK
jgi:Flp pilus assembly protein TadD